MLKYSKKVKKITLFKCLRSLNKNLMILKIINLNKLNYFKYKNKINNNLNRNMIKH